VYVWRFVLSLSPSAPSLRDVWPRCPHCLDNPFEDLCMKYSAGQMCTVSIDNINPVSSPHQGGMLRSETNRSTHAVAQKIVRISHLTSHHTTPLRLSNMDFNNP
jgi:hypothetical protein